ncbi:hypothetical protein ACVWZD_002947 [Streptomyces sp. TE3672]
MQLGMGAELIGHAEELLAAPGPRAPKSGIWPPG